MLVKVYKIGDVHFRLLRATGFHVKAENERFTAAACVRAALLFFLIQRMKSLICGAVVS